jgi:hypothetical protein
MFWPIAVATLSLALSPPGPASTLVGITGRADSVDVCALYTREEVAALSGTEAHKPRENTYQFGTVTSSSCWYRTDKSAWSVKTIVERGRTPEDLQMMLKALKGVATKTTAQSLQPVAGIGDEAYWGQIGPTNGSLHVVIGTDFLTVQTWGKAPGAGTLAKTKEVAAIVVKRYKEKYAASK